MQTPFNKYAAAWYQYHSFVAKVKRCCTVVDHPNACWAVQFKYTVFMPSSKKHRKEIHSLSFTIFSLCSVLGTAWRHVHASSIRDREAKTCTHPHANKCCRWQPMYNCCKQEVWLCSLLHYKHYAGWAPFVLLHQGPKNRTKEKMGALELPTEVFRQAVAYYST